jgi:hypothetical protein
MTYAKFIVRHGVFSSVKAETVQAVLDAAALELNATELGVNYDEAHGLLTANKLCLTPEGRNARMMVGEGPNAITTYEKEFRAVLSRSVTALSVTGGLGPVGCT